MNLFVLKQYLVLYRLITVIKNQQIVQKTTENIVFPPIFMNKS